MRLSTLDQSSSTSTNTTTTATGRIFSFFGGGRNGAVGGSERSKTTAPVAVAVTAEKIAESTASDNVEGRGKREEGEEGGEVGGAASHYVGGSTSPGGSLPLGVVEGDGGVLYTSSASTLERAEGGAKVRAGDEGENGGGIPAGSHLKPPQTAAGITTTPAPKSYGIPAAVSPSPQPSNGAKDQNGQLLVFQEKHQADTSAFASSKPIQDTLHTKPLKKRGNSQGGGSFEGVDGSGGAEEEVIALVDWPGGGGRGRSDGSANRKGTVGRGGDTAGAASEESGGKQGEIGVRGEKEAVQDGGGDGSRGNDDKNAAAVPAADVAAAPTPRFIPKVCVV